MDIKFSNIKNLFNKKKRGSKKPIVSPFRDWKIIIVVFILINIISITFGIKIFYDVEYGEITYAEDTVISINTIDRTVLVNVLNYYEGQEVLFDSIKVGGVSTVDPSR